MNVKIPFIICLALFSIQLNSAILCPPDKYLTCHDDIHYLPLVGSPTVLGGSGQLRYVDQSPNTACNVGHIIRTWYLDYNGNQNFDTGEHACLQNIYVSYTPGTTTIDWPTDIILDCKDQIPNTNPSWVSGPCDIIGVSKYDQIFGTDTKSCYKILRNFTVINWCTHVPGTNIGIWYHTQVIKIDDPSRPIIKNCDQVTLGTDVGCQANFTLTNSATDMSPCGQQKLLWKAEVDLWADGSIEYTFAHNHPDSLFRLDTVPSGQSVTINLPYPVIRGYHTVTWSVHDQCGNAAVCEQKVRVKDTKKPTPYMHDILSASFEGKDHPLRVPARIFNVGSFDNCTKPSQLRFSYSANVNDTIKVVNCNNAGFQFYTIFITDLEGNQETVDVFMLVYDNGACSNTLRLAGQVTEADNLPMTGVGFRLSRKSDATMEAMTQSNQSGQFLWENISLYQDMEVAPVFNKREQERLDIADIKMLQDYIMGRRGLINLQYLAADMDGDLAIRIKDVELLKNRILKPESFSGNHWSFAADIDSLANVTALKTVKNTIDLLNSDGILDFKAVYVGDITDANERKTGNRSSFSLTEELTDKSIQYILSQDADIEGLQVAIQLPNDALDVQINSDYFDVPNHSLHIDKNGLLRFVLTKKISLIEGDVLFSLSFGETMDGLESPELLEESKLLLADYRTSVLKIKNQNEGDIFIYPNPTVNGFTLDGDKVQIINIKNMAGQSIPYSINRNEVSWNVPSGIYIISVQVGDNVVSRKISKI